MDDDRAELERRMAQAVAAEDFEQAARLRDRIAALKPASGAGGGSMFKRQVPGRMGLGTDQQVFQPPEGWTPPKKPDLGVANRKPRRGGR
jgi:UvrB/uvrC motif